MLSLTPEEILGESKGRELQVIAFRLNSELLGIPIQRVVEITANRPITPVPKSERFVVGVINLRGKIVPVIDLKTYMGIGEFGDEVLKENRIVIVETVKGQVGISVDSIVGSIKFFEKSLNPEPVTSIGIDTDYIKGIVKLDSDVLIVLDIDAVFGKENGKAK